MAEVAAAARVGERTLYRYFADKEDLLFAEDESWRASLRAAIEQQPPGQPPFTVLRRASATVARALEDRREEVRRRGEVIASAPALAARERAKHAAWEAVLAEALGERGVAARQAGDEGVSRLPTGLMARARFPARDERVGRRYRNHA